MAVISTKDLAGFVPQGALDDGWYGAHIEEVKPMKDGARAMVKVIITDGQDQKNESDPVGRKVTDFITFGGYEKHKDGGEFAKTIAVSLLDACGLDREEFDTDEMIGSDVNILLNTSVDNRTGLPRNQVRLFASQEADEE